MADREKVIKGLERCKLYNKVNCDKCPYDYNGRGNGKSECTAELAEDALAMLKEQEAVEPKITPWKTDDNGNVIVAKRECGNCGWMFFTENPNFCENCGKAVKWK